MITCNVGKNKIDTFSYSEKQLRDWSDKGILKCPVCESKMIYHHGEFKIPHFKHSKNCDCPDIYSEGITDEHIKGIELLYNWLKIKEGVVSLELEKWIPETKQRPDIYFKHKEREYVIEFQCSPIATKFVERRNLYRLNNIKDIWILGCEKYNIVKYSLLQNYTVKDIKFSKVKLKAIETELAFQEGRIFNLLNDKLIINSNIKNSVNEKYKTYKTFFDMNINSKKLNNLKIDNILDKKEMYLIDELSEFNERINFISGATEELLAKYDGEIKHFGFNHKFSNISNNYCLEVTENSRVDLGWNTQKTTRTVYKECIKNIFIKDIESLLINKYIGELDKIVAKNEIYRCIGELKEKYERIRKPCNYKIENNEDGYFDITFEVDCEEFLFKINKEMFIYYREEFITRAFIGIRGGVEFEKNLEKLEKIRLKYDSKINILDTITYINNIVSDRLRYLKYGVYGGSK